MISLASGALGEQGSEVSFINLVNALDRQTRSHCNFTEPNVVVFEAAEQMVE
jgi:hypothetical protein